MDVTSWLACDMQHMLAHVTLQDFLRSCGILIDATTVIQQASVTRLTDSNSEHMPALAQAMYHAVATHHSPEHCMFCSSQEFCSHPHGPVTLQHITCLLTGGCLVMQILQPWLSWFLSQAASAGVQQV